MNASTRREILNDVKTMSYGLVAERRGLTRNQVAGIVWRAKNPPDTRTHSVNGYKNCNGRGYGRGVYAALTLNNTRT